METTRISKSHTQEWYECIYSTWLINCNNLTPLWPWAWYWLSLPRIFWACHTKGRHCISKQRQFDCFFRQFQANKKNQSLHWVGIHRWPMHAERRNAESASILRRHYVARFRWTYAHVLHLHQILSVLRPCARPTNAISIEFEIRPKFVVLWCKMYSTDHNIIWHTSRQCNCRDVCKIVLWSVEHSKFDRISNSIEIALVGRAPCLRFYSTVYPAYLTPHFHRPPLVLAHEWYRKWSLTAILRPFIRPRPVDILQRHFIYWIWRTTSRYPPHLILIDNQIRWNFLIILFRI